MKNVFALSTLAVGLLGSSAFALDTSKYLSCFQALNRDKVGFQGLYVDSPQAVLLTTARGERRGFYQVTKDTQTVNWITSFNKAADSTSSYQQVFRLKPEGGLPEVTAQTSYTIAGSKAQLNRPFVTLWLHSENPIQAELATLQTEAFASDRKMVAILNERIVESISNLANSYFPNTSVLAKLLSDTLTVAKAIKSARPNAEEIYIAYSHGNGGRLVSRSHAVQMLNAMKNRSLEMGEQYYKDELKEIGMTGIKEMIGACSAIGSHFIDDAIELEVGELSSFLTRNIESVRALR